MKREHLDISSGIPAVRIKKSRAAYAPEYSVYTLAQHQKIANGEVYLMNDPAESDRIRTDGWVPLLHSGDLVVSSLAPVAVIVPEEYDRTIMTNNFFRIDCSSEIDPCFLAFLINEDEDIRNQILLKSTNNQERTSAALLRGMKLPPLAPLEKQRLIGRIYILWKQLQVLKKRAADLEWIRLRQKLKGKIYETDE